jgi:hypothetical protein
VAGAGSSAENPSAARIGRSKCLMLSAGWRLACVSWCWWLYELAVCCIR